MLHLYFGPDSFSRNEALKALRRSLDQDGMLATNTAVHDGRTLRPEELFAACDTVPFLAACRLIIVEGLLTAQEGRVRRGRAARGAAREAAASPEEGSPWAALPERVGRMPETTCLVLIDGEVKPANWLLQALRPLGQVRAFPLLQREELQDWVRRRARAIQAPIQPRAAALLSDTVGSNLWQMATELEKLALYASGRPIEVADVQAIVSVARTGTVFQLVDAILAGRNRDALRLVRQLMDDGAAGPYLLTMIVRQYRQLLLARALLGQGVPRGEIARKAEVPENRIGGILSQAARYAPGQLERAYERLLEADLNVKRGIQEDDTALELLVAELAGVR